MDLATVLLATSVLLESQTNRPAPELERTYREYGAAIEAYRRCDDARAATFLDTHSPEELRSLLTTIANARDTVPFGDRVPWHAETNAAAILLHHAAARGSGGTEVRDGHLALAAEFLDRLEASDPTGELRELSYSMQTVKLQFEGDVGGLVHMLSRLPPDVRERPFFLLAIASLHDLLSTPLASVERIAGAHGGVVHPRLDSWGRRLAGVARGSKRENRDAAIRYYHEAIAAAPSDAEPYLRLAFVFIEDGQLADAESLLRSAARIDKPSILLYLEALMRARLAERRSRFDDALDRYAEASRIAPQAQTPILARARVRLLQGEPAEARDIVSSEIARTSADPDADPWWRYSFGQIWRGEMVLERLDKVVRSCAH